MSQKRKLKFEENSNHDKNYEHAQSDHEMFLQAFEKPTQIYRYLRTRHIFSPLFLPRTLTYMCKQRMSRTHRKRSNFKVDSLLSIKEKILKSTERYPKNLTLIFTGFYDKSSKIRDETVLLEAKLFKQCHKKRKDVSSPPVVEIDVGQCEVPCNPETETSKSTAFTIPSHHFTLNNGHLVKSYVLVVRVAISSSLLTECHYLANEAKKSKMEIEYTAELVVYDKQQQCLLTDGMYQLGLRECPHNSLKKCTSWETICEKSLETLDIFSQGPMVTFQLLWGDKLVSGPVETPSNMLTSNNMLLPLQFQESKCERRKQRIFYQFLYNNNTRQQTEARDDLSCPWCSLNCLELYCLIKHLKLCHSRFHFNYVPHSKGARIDVSLNECYDGSYMGNPHDLHCYPGFAYTRSGPMRRMTVTYVLVCRPQRCPPSLSEFLDPEEGDLDVAGRAYVSGHSRLYFHTGTCLPIQPHELDLDSETENDPEWLCVKTQQMIDDFTDVNDGEKELVKLWNLHVMQFGFVGNYQVPMACSTFVHKHGRHIVEKNLYKNFLLHLSNLFDFGVLPASAFYSTALSLQSLMPNTSDL